MKGLNKKLMKRIIKIAIISIVVIVVSFMYAHIDKKTYFYDKQESTGDYIGTGILVDKKLEQEFTTNENIIDALSIKCATSGNIDNVTVNYSIIENSSGNEVSSGTIAGSDIEYNEFHVFQIDHLDDTSGKKYTLEISQSGADELNGISFYIGRKSDVDSQLMINGNDTDGVIIARTLSHRFDIQTFIVLILIILYIVVFFKFLYKLFR
ncbi:MAG: hypothetical protein ACK5LL_12420 [Suipraeoptans sp.]